MGRVESELDCEARPGQRADLGGFGSEAAAPHFSPIFLPIWPSHITPEGPSCALSAD